HRVNIVAIERIEFKKLKLRIEFAGGEMEQVKDNEREHDQSAYDHVARGPTRFHVASIAILFRTRAPIFDCEKNREINMQDHSDQQKNADEPEKWTEVAQML